MTLLDYQTNHSGGSLSATDTELYTESYTESYTAKYFTFLPEVRAEVSGHTDLSTAAARCSDGAGTLMHLFFSEDNFDLARAKAICGKCRLAPTCLAGALDREEPYGVWGGQLMVDGVIVAVKRGRGRPPKHARPLLAVDEVPLPPHMVA